MSRLQPEARKLSVEEVLLFLILLAYPFDALISLSGSSSVEHEGLTLARVFVLLLIGVYSIRALWSKDSRPFRAPLGNPVSILIISYLLVVLLSALTARSAAGPVATFTQRASLFLFFYLMINIIRDRRILRLSMMMFVLASVPAVIAGGYELITGEAVISEISVTDTIVTSGLYSETGGTVRVQGLSPGPVKHSAHLVLQVGLLLYFVFWVSSWKFKTVLCALLLMAIANILASGTRSAWLSLFATLAVFVLLAPVPHRRVILTIAPIGAVALLLMLIVFFPHVAILDRLTLKHPTSGLRLGLAKVSMEMLRQNPLLGVGAGNFRDEVPRFLWVAPILRRGGRPHPHNVYLGALAETGLLGFLVYSSLQVALVMQMLRCFGRAPDREGKLMAAGLLASYIGFWVAMQFNTLWGDKYCWVVMALTVALARVISAEAKQELLAARSLKAAVD